MSIFIGGTICGVKEFSVSLSQSVDGSHHKKFRTIKGDLRDVVATAISNPWSPIVWQQNERRKTKFKSCGLVALDIDSDFPLDDAKTWLKSLKYRSAILLSKSHQKSKKTQAGIISPPCDRFRIIIDANEINDIDQYETNMKFWLAKLPMADKSCKDGARFFFASPQLAFTQDGAVYEWQNFEKEIAGERKRITEATRQRIARFKCSGSISEGLRAFILRGVPAGGRHTACYWLGCVLAEMGIGFEESVRVICAGPLAEIGEDDVREAVVYARRKVNGKS